MELLLKYMMELLLKYMMEPLLKYMMEFLLKYMMELLLKYCQFIFEYCLQFLQILWRSGGHNCLENCIRSSKINSINLLFLQSMWALWFSTHSLYTKL